MYFYHIKASNKDTNIKEVTLIIVFYDGMVEICLLYDYYYSRVLNPYYHLLYLSEISQILFFPLIDTLLHSMLNV